MTKKIINRVVTGCLDCPVRSFYCYHPDLCGLHEGIRMDDEDVTKHPHIECPLREHSVTLCLEVNCAKRIR